MKLNFKLGTRKSLLAWAQSQQVARKIEALHPHVQISLVGIETQGDLILDIPLQKVEGKDFFVAELDLALINEEVDFSVHSLKDLSLHRPPEIVCAAVTVRENPRDVALFGPGIFEKLRAGKKITIGTSSPRRLENLPAFLKNALPALGTSQDGKPLLEFVEIRGNVNTRLGRVHEPLDSPKHLDGVILAFAGMIRLWADEKGQSTLKTLLKNIRWMVLPLRECPTAPGQGALAVECRSSDSTLQNILKDLHHSETAQSVQIERQLLSEWGGGCHQKFGATQIPGNPELFFIKGKHPDGTLVDELRWKQPALDFSISPWDGSIHHFTDPVTQSLTANQIHQIQNRPLFIAHSRAIRPEHQLDLTHSRIWTSGTSSWFQLARQGLWIEGCSEGLGFQFLESTLLEKVLQLPSLNEWSCLTHKDALDEWDSKEILAIPTYKLETNLTRLEHLTHETQLEQANCFFWSSGSQFNLLKNKVPKNAVHACGPGKTSDFLKKQGINPIIFPSPKEWKKWIQSVQ